MSQSQNRRSSQTGKAATSQRPRKPAKLQPILIDRLAHALASRGVDLKRTDLLQIAAAAFGYHNANEFSAGNLVVEAAKPVGETILPDGNRMIVVRDPLANACYGIETSFIEQSIAEDRREFLGVSPFGHLLDLSALPDLKPGDLARASLTPGATIHFAVIEHKHGTSGYVGRTLDELYREIAGFCREYWHEVEARGAGPISEYETDSEIVSCYFEYSPESYYIEEAKLPTAPSDAGRPVDPPKGPHHPIFTVDDHESHSILTGREITYEAWINERKAAFESGSWLDRHAILNQKIGDIVQMEIHWANNNGVAIYPGHIAKIKNIVPMGGDIHVEVEFNGLQTLIFTANERGGYFPFSSVSAAKSEIVLHPRSDWQAAKAQHATGSSYEVWSSERMIHKIHLSEKWLTKEDMGGLAPGDRLTLRIYGKAKAFDAENYMSFDTNYFPGDIVIVTKVSNQTRAIADTLTVITEDGAILQFGERQGYFPVSKIDLSEKPVAKAKAIAESPKKADLPALGTVVNFPGVDAHITVEGLLDEQPLSDDGIVLFNDQYGETQMCQHTPDGWEIVPEYGLSDDQKTAVFGLI